MLCAHSRVVGGPELMFGGRIAELHRHMAWIARTGPAPYRERLTSYLDAQQIDQSFRSFYRSFFEPLVAGSDAALIAEKTPSNIFAARPLLELFPGSRFVHLVRDGRDVVASHRSVARRARAGSGAVPAGTSLRQVCQRWNQAAEADLSLRADKVLASRYHWLRYEDLVREPEQRMSALMAFLGLDLEERQLHPESVDASTLVIDGVWHVEGEQRRGWDTHSVGRWKGDLGFWSKLIASLVLARGLEQYGYRPPRWAMAAGAPLRAALAWIGSRRSAPLP